MPDETGMVKRGLLLLGVIGILATVVVVILLGNRSSAAPKAAAPPEILVAGLVAPGTGFPLAINWAALHELGGSLPSAPGWKIRYTATRVLAHRGSPQTPLPILCEMLDADQQQRNFQSRLPDGRLVTDDAAAYHEVLIALKAVGEWHKKGKAPRDSSTRREFDKLRAAVAKLTGSSNSVVSTRAREILLLLDSAKS